MVIFLVQHGQCFEKETDPERSLSPKGRNDVIRIADQASQAGVSVSTIFHSGKLRSQQTAELFAGRLNADRVERISGIDPTDSVEEFVGSFQWPAHSMIVGHLPFMERLASFMITGKPEPVVVKFQNAGIVCIEKNENDHWHVKWTIMPVIE